MSWKIIDSYRQRLAVESGTIDKGWGGKLTVCLVYPNRYRSGMSNLGLQTVYGLLNAEDDILCERAFLPEPDEAAEYAKSRTPLLSYESQRPLHDFDVIAFSISFESDYLQLPPIFELARIPALSIERDTSHPLIIAGGAALFLNPEPVADFMDLICLGEAEVIIPPLLELLRSAGDRQGLLNNACHRPGIYVPAFYEPVYNGARLLSFTSSHGASLPVQRGVLTDLDRVPTSSTLVGEESEFGDMFLVEVSRGCPRGCRFCAASFIYHPYRWRSMESLKGQVEEAAAGGRKVGLVGAAVSDYPGIGELSRHIIDCGGTVSVSSLRVDALDDDMIEMLKASGHKTVAIAPEGGSQRLRDMIRKNLTEEEILAACRRLIAHGILNLKLYVIIGLPTETAEDLQELLALVMKIRSEVIEASRQLGRLGEVTVSVNPFVPKPFTPFQWCAMEPVATLERKGELLRKGLMRLSNVRFKMESPKEALLQALLSRGDRRFARFIMAAHEQGSWRRALKALPLPADQLAGRTIALDELLPWEFISGVDRKLLEGEYRRAFP
jgi:radical SAM superfamily enzyme YgiQ (UPF0313 family)